MAMQGRRRNVKDLVAKLVFRSPANQAKSLCEAPRLCNACCIWILKPPLEQLSCKFQHAHSYPSNGGGQLFTHLNLKTYCTFCKDTCRPRPATLIYATKRSLRALDSSANWTQKGGWYPGYQYSKCSQGGNAV